MKNTSSVHESELTIQQEVAALRKQVMELTALVKHYEQQLLLLKRRQFGASSEKTDVDIRQMSFFEEPEPVDVPEEPETEDISYSRRKRKGKRDEDLSGLPTERVDYELSESERHCPQCGETMRDIGEEDIPLRDKIEFQIEVYSI